MTLVHVTTKPSLVERIRAHVPAQLLALPVWMLWTLETKSDGGERKVPIYADGANRTGTLDTPEDRARLVTFDEAAEALSRVRRAIGLGVALGPVPKTELVVSGIDLDHCVDERGDFDQRALDVMGAADSYSERSPSGDGVHVLGYGYIGTVGKRPDRDLEMYSGGRFFTMTGDALNQAGLAELADAAAFARRLYGVEQHVDDEARELPPLPKASPERWARERNGVAAALAYLDPTSYDDWIRVGMAIHLASGGSDDGFELWHSWSAGGITGEAPANYSGIDDCRYHWSTYNRRARERAKSVTLGTLFEMAKMRGYVSRPARPKAPEPSNDERQPAGTSAKVEPLCDLADIGVGEFLDTEPEPRVWIVDRWLPLGVVGVFASAGGVGKSFLMLQLAIAIATGRRFLGMEVTDPGSVLMLCAEDERDELHRRLRRIVALMREGEEFGTREDELLRERLFIHSRVGLDNRLTTMLEGELVRTNMADRIIALADQIPALKIIILDPASRFSGGIENANEHATRLVEVLEYMRSETGATIEVPHHVNKESLRAGHEQLGIESLRGASGLPDAARWVAVMGTLRRDAAAEYGIDRDDAGRYVRLDAPKVSYAAPWPGMWLERSHGGVLVPTDMPTKRGQRDEQRGNKRYLETLPKLRGLIEQEQTKGTPLTRTRLRDFAGTAGLFGMSDKTLRGVAERAIAEGAIRVRFKGRTEELTL